LIELEERPLHEIGSPASRQFVGQVKVPLRLGCVVRSARGRLQHLGDVRIENQRNAFARSVKPAEIDKLRGERHPDPKKVVVVRVVRNHAAERGDAVLAGEFVEPLDPSRASRHSISFLPATGSPSAARTNHCRPPGPNPHTIDARKASI
jgi:hypothetical protein